MTESDDLSRAIHTVGHLGRRLRLSLEQLAPFHPFDGTTVQRLDAALPEAADAFLKRFENLVNFIQDQVWRQIAVEVGFRNPNELTRRDLADEMVRAGLLASTEAFLVVVRVRNLLSHIYPDAPERQARRLNEAYLATATLLAATAAAEAWAARRGIAPGGMP